MDYDLVIVRQKWLDQTFSFNLLTKNSVTPHIKFPQANGTITDICTIGLKEITMYTKRVFSLSTSAILRPFLFPLIIVYTFQALLKGF